MEEPKCYRNKKSGRCTKTDDKHPSSTDDCYYSVRVKRCKNRYKTVKKTGYNTISRAEVEAVWKKMIDDTYITVSTQLTEYLWKWLNKKQVAVIRKKNRDYGLGFSFENNSDKQVLVEIEKEIIFKSLMYLQEKQVNKLSRDMVKKVIKSEPKLKRILL